MNSLEVTLYSAKLLTALARHNISHCIMGNCIYSLCHQPEEKSRVLIYNGGEKLFKASTRVKKITSGHFHGYKLVHQDQPDEPLSLNSKLESGEVYYLVPPKEQPCYSPVLSSKLTSLGTCKRQKVKIVLTRQQLELLLRNAAEFKSKGIAIRSTEGDGKWQPSLATIPEVSEF